MIDATKDFNEINLSIAKMEAELALAKARRADILLEGDDKQLASRIHKKTCRERHDGYNCYWNHEQSNGMTDWAGTQHELFLTKAQRILEIVDMDTAVKLVDLVTDRGMR